MYEIFGVICPSVPRGISLIGRSVRDFLGVKYNGNVPCSIRDLISFAFKLGMVISRFRCQDVFAARRGRENAVSFSRFRAF